MTNPLYVNETLPADDLAAMREFDDRYIAAIGAGLPPTWADAGDLFPTDAPLVTYPISSLAIAYQQTEGESRFKGLLAKSFDLRTEEFDAGLEASLLDLTTKVFAYRNWQLGPSRMMIAEARKRNRMIVALLEDGENQKWGSTARNPDGIDGVNFFSATHLSNFNDPDSATWSNYQVSTKDVISIANIAAEVTAMQGVLDENGEKVGADPDVIMVPTAKYEGVKNLLAQALILAEASTATSNGAVNNPFLGRFTVVHNPELTDVNDWYLIDSKLRASSGLPPWISARYTAPGPALALRHWDESSDHFKNTGNIKVSSHIWYGHALAFPHSIRKIKGA